jgi:hypothetical protein
MRYTRDTTRHTTLYGGENINKLDHHSFIGIGAKQIKFSIMSLIMFANVCIAVRQTDSPNFSVIKRLPLSNFLI